MSGTTGLEDLLLLVLAALIPSLLYLTWFRRTEQFEREPWGRLLSGFGWGALIATVVAGIIEAILIGAGAALDQAIPAPEFTFLQPDSAWNLIFVVLVIAPFTEEAMKAAGVARSLGPIRSLADGPVIGTSVGLGFGFFETFLYGLGAFLIGGLSAGLTLIFVRSISSVLLHGSSTAMFGYGYARGTLEPGKGFGFGYYLLAVGMHSSFNFLASLSALLPLLGITIVSPDDAAVIGFLLAITFAFSAAGHVRTVIQRSSFPGAEGMHPRFRPPPARPRQR